MDKIIKTARIELWFYSFTFLYAAAWTLTPWLIRYTLPRDAMEGTTWGRQLEWGYDKNPFMNGWLTELAVQLSGQSGWAIYLFGQLSVALCFWAVWQLSKKMLPPIYALISVLLLGVIQYYNFHAVDFNDNTLELGLWALTTLFFYQAAQEYSLKNWLLTGFFAGLSMMTKYYSAMLLLPMFLFLLRNHHARQNLKRIPFYFGLLAFFIIITPHVIWLFSHDFVTVNYAVHRVSNHSKWLSHIIYPARFAWQQLQAFLPALFMLSVFFIGKNTEIPRPHIQLSAFDKQFLILIGLGPFLLTVFVSACAGLTLRAGWGQPLLSLWGILLVAALKPSITPQRLYRFTVLILSVIAVMVIAYCIAFIRADEESSANYPGKNIAAAITKTWNETYHTPLTYVAGTRWLAGNISFYSANRPAVYIDWNEKISPWVDEKELRKQGAVFVWDPSVKKQISFEDIKKRFPDISEIQVLHFAWMRNKAMAPVEIGVAFLPPSKNV